MERRAVKKDKIVPKTQDSMDLTLKSLLIVLSSVHALDVDRSIVHVLPIKGFLTVVFLQAGRDPSRPPVLSGPDLPSVDSVLPSPGEHGPSLSPEAPPPCNMSSLPCPGESLHPDQLHPGCELSSQASEAPTEGASSPPPPPPPPPAGGQEAPPSEDSFLQTRTAAPNPQPASEQDGTSKNRPSGHGCAAVPGVTFDLEVPEGTGEPSEGSAATDAGSEGETLESAEIADDQTLSPFVSHPSQKSHDPDASGAEDAPQNPPNSPPEAPELRAAADVSRNLMSSAAVLGGIVSLSIVLQEPSTLFFIGLLLVLRRL